jgi:hypothetical protein
MKLGQLLKGIPDYDLSGDPEQEIQRSMGWAMTHAK